MKYLLQVIAGIVALFCTVLSLIFFQPIIKNNDNVLYVTIESATGSTIAVQSIQKIGGARLSIDNNNAFPITIHLPEKFSPVSAKHSTIEDIIQEAISSSQKTFTLPAYSGVTVEGAVEYTSLRIYNKNTVSLLVYFSRISLDDNNVIHDSKLIVGKRGELW